MSRVPSVLGLLGAALVIAGLAVLLSGCATTACHECEPNDQEGVVFEPEVQS
jgi:hypothetical protein